MAKIKLKIGDCEVEIDSRDFYVDNNSIDDILENLSEKIQRFQTRIDSNNISSQDDSSIEVIDQLEDAEFHEPEFSYTSKISSESIRNKILILSQNSFFDKPRTVIETIEELRNHGWSASPLDVSKTLSKMSLNKEILKNSHNKHNFYFIKESLFTN